MADCIFCRIISDESMQKEQKIFEDNKLLIMLTQRPQTPGHTLILTKKHYASLEKVPQKIRRVVFEKAVKIGEILKKALGAKAYFLKVNSGLYLLEEEKGHVGHIHMHIVPRYSSKEVLEEIPPKMPVEELMKIRDKIRIGGDEVWRDQYFQESEQK